MLLANEVIQHATLHQGKDFTSNEKTETNLDNFTTVHYYYPVSSLYSRKPVKKKCTCKVSASK